MRLALLVLAAGCGRLEFAPVEIAADGADGGAPEPDLRLLFPQYANDFVGYWRMNGDWSDASTQNNALANLSGTGAFGPGIGGAQSATFYDVSFVVTNRPSIEVSYFSYSAWFQSDLVSTPNSNSGHTLFKFSCATCGGSSDIDIAALVSVNNDGSLQDTNGQTAGALVQPNTWHHVAGVYGASGSSIFLDGVRVHNTTVANTPLPTSGGYLWVGQLWPNSAPLWNPQYLHGSMQELAIWNAELTEAELASIYANQR